MLEDTEGLVVAGLLVACGRSVLVCFGLHPERASGANHLTNGALRERVLYLGHPRAIDVRVRLAVRTESRNGAVCRGVH